MDIRDIMASDDGYAGNLYNMPKEYASRAKDLCFKFNQLMPSQADEKKKILNELLGTYSGKGFIAPGFQCDYGKNIHMHGLAVINYNCVILDTSPVHLGDGVFIAPNVVISPASHPVDMEQRLKGIGTSKPVVLEDGVWIGASSVILGGVSIGTGSVIGAGSVVTKDIPAGVIASGNPCTVRREITERDRLEPEDIIF